MWYIFNKDEQFIFKILSNQILKQIIRWVVLNQDENPNQWGGSK